MITSSQMAVLCPSVGVSRLLSGIDLEGAQRGKGRCCHGNPGIIEIPRCITCIYTTLVASVIIISRKYTAVILVDTSMASFHLCP